MGNRTRVIGLEFENIILKQARMQGLYVRKEPIAARRFGLKSLYQIKSDYDFKLILPPLGICVFLDAKSTEDTKFVYSKLVPHQVGALLEIQRAGCLSGYLIWFRTINRVIFFDAEKLDKLQPRESLLPENGTDLGSFENMHLGNLFA